MQNRISVQELVAYNNTPKARALVARYGYQQPQNYDELIQTLLVFTKDYKKEALEEIAKLHPHKDLILNFNYDNLRTEILKECPSNHNQRYSNFEYERYIDAEGSKKDTSTKDNFEKYLPLIAVAGIFALAITTISRK